MGPPLLVVQYPIMPELAASKAYSDAAPNCWLRMTATVPVPTAFALSMASVMARDPATWPSPLPASMMAIWSAAGPDPVIRKEACLAALEIAKAVEEIFNVNVIKVNVIRTKSKPKRRGLVSGRTSSGKKAIVQLPEGQKIEFFESM